MTKQPIILAGGGGHCKSCIDVVEQTGLYQIRGILDPDIPVGTTILGYPVLGDDTEIPSLIQQGCHFLITVGQIKSANARSSLYENIKQAGGHLPVIISPSAVVSRFAAIAEGTIIMHQACVTAEASIGVACILNSKALVEHESVIGDFCHISTAACVNGQVKIGSHCFIGSNVVIGNNLIITDKVQVAAGSQVLKSLLNPGIYIGNPLRRIR